jgi:hypothetical protein
VSSGGQSRLWFLAVAAALGTLACTGPNPAFLGVVSLPGDSGTNLDQAATAGASGSGGLAGSGSGGSGAGGSGAGGTGAGGTGGSGGATVDAPLDQPNGSDAMNPDVPVDQSGPRDTAAEAAPEAAPPVDPRPTGMLAILLPLSGPPASGNTLSGGANVTATLNNVTWNPNDRAPGVPAGSQSAVFNGTNSYIRLAMNPMPDSNADKTIALWIRNTSTSGLTDLVSIYHSKLETNNSIQLGLTGARLAGWRFGHDPEMTAPSNLDTRWHHAAYVFEKGVHSLYQDGLPVGSFSGGCATGAVDRILIGTYLEGTNRIDELFKGQMNDVRVYNKALTAAEIMTLANPPPQ